MAAVAMACLSPVVDHDRAPRTTTTGVWFGMLWCFASLLQNAGLTLAALPLGNCDVLDSRENCPAIERALAALALPGVQNYARWDAFMLFLCVLCTLMVPFSWILGLFSKR